ncbi:ArsR/SmtB family transcription factor [Kitasatospora sp. NPDC059599]|uniref:ArsR/SmtB family transcription factor n=1 Tax=Kitasatospora sp. NPDC059599 TaxID=3346880 RepID=UPI0036977173
MAVDQLSRAFVALADPTRRDIVARLSTRDATVGELAESYAMSMQAVSKHLKVLEEAGLVSRSRDGQRRPCHLEPQVFDLMTSWIERYRRQAEERFSRLDALLAGMSDDTTAHAASHTPTRGATHGARNDHHTDHTDDTDDTDPPQQSEGVPS